MVRFNYSIIATMFVVFVFNVSIVTGQNSTNNTENKSFLSILSTDPNLSFAAAAVAASRLILPSDSSTIFAPNNYAFMNGDPNVTITTAEVLFQPNYIAHLQNLLLLHIVDSTAILSNTLVDGGMIKAANSETISVSIPFDGNISLSTPYMEQSANIVDANIMSSDGVLHQIDSILYPSFVGMNVSSRLANGADLSIFYELFQLSGLDKLFGRDATVTIFVPTDETLNELEAIGVVTYLRSNITATKLLLSGHIVTTRVIPTQNMTTGSLLTLANTTIDIAVDNDLIFVNTEQILEANVLANNGILHIIDRVFTVPGVVFPTVNTTPSTPTTMTQQPPAAAPPTGTSGSIVYYLHYGYVILTAYFGWSILMV
jgi:transforming growth factor-beta-induced protein